MKRRHQLAFRRKDTGKQAAGERRVIRLVQQPLRDKFVDNRLPVGCVEVCTVQDAGNRVGDRVQRLRALGCVIQPPDLALMKL